MPSARPTALALPALSPLIISVRRPRPRSVAIAAAAPGLSVSPKASRPSRRHGAMQAAGITLMRGDPALVAQAIDISRRTSAKIRQNLFWAFFYNVVGIPLAAFGLLNPVVAGAAMAMSSVSVLTNALLLKRWRPKA